MDGKKLTEEWVKWHESSGRCCWPLPSRISRLAFKRLEPIPMIDWHKPFLTKAEAAEFLSWSEQTLENKMSRGVFRRGVHYYKRDGEISVRFDREALVNWLKEGTGIGGEASEQVRLIQLPRGKLTSKRATV